MKRSLLAATAIASLVLPLLVPVTEAIAQERGAHPQRRLERQEELQERRAERRAERSQRRAERPQRPARTEPAVREERRAQGGVPGREDHRAGRDQLDRRVAAGGGGPVRPATGLDVQERRQDHRDDRRDDRRDRREDRRDRGEDRRDRGEDRRDRGEDRRDRGEDRRGDRRDRGDNHRDYRHDRRDHREWRRQWNRDHWRRDWSRRHRADWWRDHNWFRNYSGLRLNFYFAPGYGYYQVPRQYYRRQWREGDYLPRVFWRYRVNNHNWYGLPWPPPGTEWVYVDNHIYLVDMRDGYIIDVISDAWRW